MSDRDLKPGESYVSAIISDGEELQRVDVGASAWQGPQPETVGWWRSRMPQSASGRLRAAPSGVLLDTLTSLLECPGKDALAYVLALYLVRRRVLVEEEASDSDPGTGDARLWQLSCSADQRKWFVPVCHPSPSTYPKLHDELNALLFTEE